jgi:hypothetical protein
MTLTNALCAALNDPPHRDLLRTIGDRLCDDAREIRQTMTAQIIRIALRDADHLVAHVRLMADVLVTDGASLEDIVTVIGEARHAPEIRRSPQWVAAATRLAQWADKQVTP